MKLVPRTPFLLSKLLPVYLLSARWQWLLRRRRDSRLLRPCPVVPLPNERSDSSEAMDTLSILTSLSSRRPLSRPRNSWLGTSIHASYQRKSQLAAAAAGPPKKSTLQYQPSGTTPLQGPPASISFPTGSPVGNQAVVAQSVGIGTGPLSDTVSDSTSPVAVGNADGPLAIQYDASHYDAMSRLQHRINTSDARADQTDDRIMDMAQDVKSLLAQLQQSARDTASLAAVGQAETARVATSVSEAATADRAADSARWEALQLQLDQDLRAPASILDQRLAMNASSAAEQHTTANSGSTLTIYGRPLTWLR